MAYYAPPPRPDRGSFSYHYPQDIGYGYAASPNPPYPTNASYYPPSSSKPRTTTPANYPYYPPPSPSSAYPASPGAAPGAAPKPRRRSVSFSTPVVVVEPTPSEKKKEMLYRHINIGTTPAAAAPKSPKSPSSKPRRFSKTYDDLDYEYLRTSYKDDSYPQVFDDDSQEDDVVYEYNKEKLSRRFDRSKTGGGLGLRRSSTVTEKLSPSSSSSKSPKYSYAEVKMPSLHIPRAPRPPAPQRTTPPPPPPPPAPASNISRGSDRSRKSDRATYGGTTVRGDYDDYEYEYEYVSDRRKDYHREEKKEKNWMNINGNKIVVDHKGVKINGQRYDAPGGKGTFNVGGIKIRVDGGVISLV